MASSGNFCTWNPLAEGNKSDIDFSSGNCAVTSGSGQFKSLSTVALSTNSGKWYVEICLTTNSSNTGYVGIVSDKSTDLNATGDGFNFGRSSGDKTVFLDLPIGKIKTENSDSQTGLSTFTSTDDIIGMVLDMDNDTVQFYGNGSALGSAQAFPDVGDDYFIWCGGNNDKVFHINAGQDSTFAGNLSAGGNADANSFGDFKYSVPTDAKAICSANLPVASGVDPNLTDDNYPGKQFFISQYAGNLTARTITTEAQPDLIIIRSYDNPQNWYVVDSSRGITANKYLITNNSDAEATFPQSNFTSVSTTSVGISAGTWLNSTGQNTNMWMWKCNGGTTATNTQGTITSTVQANQDAEFSIITYAGTGSNATLGHGLSSAPEFMIFKRTSSPAQSWKVYHKSLGATKFLTLNDNSSAGTDSTMFNNTEPTNSVISIGTQSNTNTSGLNYICYAWSGVSGFSKFGKYTGNGNADGPFVYLGFKPKFLIIKRNATDNWFVFDTARDSVNVMGKYMQLDENIAHTGSNLIDFYSTGFKLRSSSASLNPSGGEHLYAAWGEIPAKYNNAR